MRDAAIPPLARGEGLAAFALTESGSGSDAGSLRTAARADGNGGWVIDGAKQWITNGSYASEVVVFARTRPDVPGPGGVSAFLVEGGTPGLVAVREEEKLGLTLELHRGPGVRRRARARRAPARRGGRGFAIAMETLDSGRITIAAQALGVAQRGARFRARLRARAQDVRQALSASTGGAGPAGGHGHDLAAARALTYDAARLRDAGRPHTLAGAKAKLFAARVARQGRRRIQVLGGYGYTREFPVERYYRDAKVTEIYEGPPRSSGS